MNILTSSPIRTNSAPMRHTTVSRISSSGHNVHCCALIANSHHNMARDQAALIAKGVMDVVRIKRSYVFKETCPT